MRSKLILQHPWRAPPQAWWYFSGADDALLRRCIGQLDEFAAPDPDDRKVAAIVLGNDDQENPSRGDHHVGAWTAEGALRLADLLPDKLADVRQDLRRLLGDSAG